MAKHHHPSVSSEFLNPLPVPSALCAPKHIGQVWGESSSTWRHTLVGPCSSRTLSSSFSCLVTRIERNKEAVSGMSGRTPAMADSLEIKGLFLYKYIYIYIYIYIFFSLSVTFFSIAFYNTSYQIKKKKFPVSVYKQESPFPPYLVRSLTCTVLWPLVLPKTGCRVFTILPQQALSNLKYQVLEAFYQLLLSISGLWLFPFLQYLRGIFQP